MTTLLAFSLLALALLALLLWLLRAPARDAAARAGAPAPEELFPQHCQRFPQVRQALGSRDEEFLRGRASPALQRRWRRERRRVLRGYLAGLREDYRRLLTLARMLARLAPELDRRREGEMLWLALRFKMLYTLVHLRIALGWRPEQALERLAGRIGTLAAELDAGMVALERTTAGAGRVSG